MKITTLFTIALCLAGAAFAQIEWDAAPDVQKGTKLVKLERTEPRLMKICVMRIDLMTEGLRVTATERAPDWGKPMPDYTNSVVTICTRREKTASFMNRMRESRGLNMTVAVNTAPWWPWCPPWNHKYAHPTGVQISDGVIITDDWRQELPMLIFHKKSAAKSNGLSAEIVTSLTKEDAEKVWVGHTGFSVILKNGEICGAGAYEKATHPRTAMGLSADKRWLFIVTVDGRQEGWSIGADGNDLCKIMLEAGATDAINMDGGGSTTLCYWDDAKNAPEVCSHHAGNAQRTVALNIGFYIDSAAENDKK